MNEGEAESRTSSDYNKDYDDGDPESSGAAALNDDFELSADEDDDGHDDVLGPCKIAGIDGAMMRCIFHEEGKDVIRERTKGHVRVVVHLWARMLVQFSDEYPLVLRLVVIALLIPADTSECERIFSLMNDIKTAERESLGQTVLRNLMHWHIEGKGMACKDVLVMAILKEWRSMATGPKGRGPHRPAL